MSPTPGPWGGYKNGEIPVSQLVPVRNEPLHPAAAAAMVKLEAGFKAKFGHEFIIVDAYRPYARQVELYRLYQQGKGNLAAYPGTSNHGWALAADLGSNIDLAKSQEHYWIAANAPALGWAVDVVKGEPWHVEYTGSLTIPKPPAPPAKRNRSDMAVCYVNKDANPDIWVLAGSSPGTTANWLETTNSGLGTQWGNVCGGTVTISAATFANFKKYYLMPVNTTK